MMQPVNTTPEIWADSLVIDFPYDNVPKLMDERDWREWGDTLVQEPTFVDNGAPSTKGFTKWEDWASDVYSALSQVQF
jgi:hypothetical protein